MSIYFLTQFIAYITPFDWVEELEWSLPPLPCFICAIAFIVITVIDYFTFDFLPLQKNLIFDNEKGTQNIHMNKGSQILNRSTAPNQSSIAIDGSYTDFRIA